MGYREVWGFDPDEATEAQLRFRAILERGGVWHDRNEEINAVIPETVREQIHALEILFRL